MDQVWKFFSTQYLSSNIEFFFEGIFQLPMMKYNEEKLNGKLWPWIRGEKWRKQRMMAQAFFLLQFFVLFKINSSFLLSRRRNIFLVTWIPSLMEMSSILSPSSFSFCF